MRHTDWTKRLDQYLKHTLRRSFDWGHWDCGEFVAGAIFSMNGTDIKHWVKPYHTKFGAWRLVVKQGCKTFGEAEAKILDDVARRVPLCFKLIFGDIVLAEIDNLDPRANGLTVGVVSRTGMFLAPGKDGLVEIEKFKPEAIWSV